MGKIKKVVETRFIDEDEGFEYYHEPAENTLTIKKTPDGYEARYLVRDSEPMPPDECDDDNLFLLNYHRDFDVRRDKIITKDEVVAWYRKEEESGKEGYWMFPLSCYVHSGILLSLRTGNWNPFDQEGWDTSHVGAVLVSKEEWPDEKKATEVAEGLVETWNQYLSGDVYGIVKETYDKDKTPIDQDSCWGFYGHKYALQALQTEI